MWLRSAGRRLPLAGLVVGVWALLPPYTGPDLGTSSRVEIADHVVPAVVILAVSLGALALAAAPRPRQQELLLAAGLVVVLAGIWMTATHLPLVAQARRGEAPTGGVAHHSAPGVVALALGAAWARSHWRELPP